MSNIVLTKRKVNKFHLSLCLLCISWINGGFFSRIPFFGFFSLIALFMLWYLIAFRTSNYKLIVDNKWMYIYAFVVLASSLFLTPILNKHTYGILYLFIISLFALYYSRNVFEEERRIIWFFYLTEICVISLVSTVLCIQNPNIARIYASGMGETAEISNYLLANFGIVYTLPLIVVFLIFSYSKLKNKKLIVLIVPMLTCLYFVNFATAIFVLVIFLLVAFLVKKPSRICICGVLIVVLAVIFKYKIADLCNYLSANNWLGEFISGKLKNIADTINSATIYQDSNTLNMRLQYTKDAIEVFKNHPILGIYGFNSFMDERLLLRDHNVWVDMLAYFGVVRIVPYIAFLVTWYKNTQRKTNYCIKYSIAYVTIIWFIYGFLNPMNKYQVFIFMYMMLPLSKTLLKSYQKDEMI